MAASPRPANNTRPPRVSRKTWSAKDADHIPKGRRVMIMVDPDKLHPTIAAVRGDLVQFIGEMTAPIQRYGIVERRQIHGSYMVQLENSQWGISFPRSALLYPVPANVLALPRKGTS
jgi:hypothetical protein